jgi:preprotein translocase subunit SecE
MARDVPIGTGGTPSRRRETRPAGEVEARPRRGGPFGSAWRFIGESWAELQKVEWPKQNQLIQGTVVVIVACIIVGAFLYLNDEIWKNVVQKVLLK